MTKEEVLIVISDACVRTSKWLVLGTIGVALLGFGASIWADKEEFKRYKRSVEEAAAEERNRNSNRRARYGK